MFEGEELGECLQFTPQGGLEWRASTGAEGRAEEESGVLSRILHSRKSYKTPNGCLELTEIGTNACLEDARWSQSDGLIGEDLGHLRNPQIPHLLMHNSVHKEHHASAESSARLNSAHGNAGNSALTASSRSSLPAAGAHPQQQELTSSTASPVPSTLPVPAQNPQVGAPGTPTSESGQQSSSRFIMVVS